jgi:hypothetical protein
VVAGVVAGVVAAGVPGGLLGAPPLRAAALPRAATPDPLPVQVSVTRIVPQVPRPGDTLSLTGSVLNTGPDTYDAVTVRLRVSPNRLINRTEVRQVADGTPQVRDGVSVPGSERQVATGLRPGARANWALSVPVDRLPLGGNGVYVVGVEARASLGGAGLERVGLRKTFLPWLPRPGLLVPTRLAWLWPVTATPTRDVDGAFTSPRAAQGLAEATAAGGRLETLASAPGSMPVTWLVDPDLLESVQALAAEHRIRSGRRIANAPPDPVAARWLAALRQSMAGGTVAALPYADPDVAALARSGQASWIGRAVTRGVASASQQLGRPIGASPAWPADGLADGRTLRALRQAGSSTVVLDSTAVTAAVAANYTPTGRTRVTTAAGPIDVLVADAGLGGALAGDLTDAGTATLAAQRFLADTALITLERPLVARTVLVAPPRHWSPPANWLAGLLAEVRRAPWLQVASTDRLREAPPAPELRGAAVAYPPSAAARELPRPYLTDVRRVAGQAERVTSVLARPEAVTERYDAALLRALWSGWRANLAPARSYLTSLRNNIAAERNKVRVIGRDLVTLSSKSGTIPVTVTNETTQPVSLRLALLPKVPSRLEVGPPQGIRIGAGRKITVKVPAAASANGLTPVDVQLQTPDGQPYGPRTTLRVNATNYGNVGLAVVLAAGLLLFVAGIVRRLRRRRRGQSGGDPDPLAGMVPQTARTDEKVQA